MKTLKRDDEVSVVFMLMSAAATFSLFYLVIVTDPRNKIENVAFNENQREPSFRQETNQYVNFIHRKETEENSDNPEQEFLYFGKPKTGAEQIFFIETSCLKSKRSENNLNSKLELDDTQVCAIESAAKANPNKNIYIFYSCLLPKLTSIEQSSLKVRKLFDQYNIYLWQPKMALLFENSPLERFYNRLQWKQKISKQMLSYLVLWKYGGVSIDLDFATLRSFSHLGSDFVVLDDEHRVHPGVLGVGTAGKSLVAGYMEMLEEWSIKNKTAGQEDEALTLTLWNMCDVTKMLGSECHGMNIVASKDFYAVDPRDVPTPGSAENIRSIFTKNKGKTAIKINRRKLENEISKVLSEQAFDSSLRNYCPSLFVK